MTKQLVSVIIANWNGGKIFENCIKSLKNLSYPKWELIVVDNGSSDGSEKYPEKYKLSCERYSIIKNKKNVGFAPANNQGLKIAKGRYILLLNNDTEVPVNFMNLMISRMEKDRTLGAIQPKIKLMDRPGFLDNSGTFLTQTGFLEHWGFMERDSKEFSKERIIFAGKGAALLIRSEVVKKAGGLFDDDFVSYFEDSDFCLRVWLSGYKVLYFPSAFVYHKLGYTSNKMPQVEINYNSLKNSISSYFKNFGILGLLTVFVPHLIIILGLCVYYIFTFKWDRARMVFSAIGWNIIHIKSNLRKRAMIQKLRKVSDQYIFSQVMHKANFFRLLSHFIKIEANFKK